MSNSTLTLDVYTCEGFELPSGGMFSPTTSTLITGPTEAMLVDTQYRAADVDEVIRRIEDSGKRLSTIFITHGHSDHYFGLQRLLSRFPHARPVAIPSVAAHIAANLESDRAAAQAFFAGQALDNTVVPLPLTYSTLTVDGIAVHAIAIPQADIAPTAILHIPSIAAVIVGDAIYNGVNPFLAVTGPHEWQQWLASIDAIAALNPSTVVAGHKRPGAADTAYCVAETRSYIQQFAANVDSCRDSRELVAQMQSIFPDHVNPSALVLSAVTAFKRKKQTHA
ncbi:MBL fold metallo-hydrolase [Nocardia sp. bgisy134]|uniref:MBL fold metallo-hydrolase n=1 Tax=Nocardia sp. bgisy134 TaxID=3413789 RepID=UPI003D731566